MSCQVNASRVVGEAQASLGAKKNMAEGRFWKRKVKGD